MAETECQIKDQCREIIIGAQVPIEWALPLYGYVMPIIVAITLATNSFIVVVLSRRHLRTPTNIVLLAMAVTELLTGLSCLPWLLYYYTFEGYKTEQTLGLPAFWCSMFPYMASILPSIFHTAAIWLTVYLAVQRYIYICVPKMVRKQCTIRRSKQVIATICMASVWIYAPELFANYNKSHEKFYPHSNFSRLACFRYRTSFIDFVGSNIYYYAIFGVHTLLSHTLPCILLVCFTWKLIATIRLADQRYTHLIASRNQAHRKYTPSNIVDAKTSIDFSMDVSQFDATSATCGDSLKGVGTSKRRTSTFESKRVQSLKQNTRMLIAVILLFLVTEIPAALIFSLHVSTVALRIIYMQRHYVVLNKLLIIRNVLIVVTYPLRFAIYCGMSEQFRDSVHKMLVRSKSATVGNNDIQYEHILTRHNSRADNNNYCGNGCGALTVRLLDRSAISRCNTVITINSTSAQRACNRSHSSGDAFACGGGNTAKTALMRSSNDEKCAVTANGYLKFQENYATTVSGVVDSAAIVDGAETSNNGSSNSISQCDSVQRIQIEDSGCAIDSDDLSNDSRNDETI